MAHLLKRETSAPAGGLLPSEHFQMAYATNDIDKACDLFSRQLGIREFRRLEGPLATGGHIRVELAWVGTIMYELLTASGPGSEVYVGRLPSGEGFALRHHHLGYLVPDLAQWRALIATARHKGYAVPSESENPGFLRASFVDVPELGHYLEYICPEPAGLAFFNNVPRN